MIVAIDQSSPVGIPIPDILVTMSDEIDLLREVSRRRKFMLAASPALVVAVIRGVSQLSVSTVTRMTRICTATLDDPVTGKSMTLDLPCRPQEVQEVASWRGPATIVAVAVVVVAVGLLWLMMPRLTTRDTQRLSTARLTGKALSGSRMRYRLHPVQRWILYVVAAPIVVGGVLLGVLHTGAPTAIVAIFITLGALIAYSAGAGDVTVSTDRLIVRTMLRRRVWQWSQIARLEAVDGTIGRTQAACRLLAIHTHDGKVFANKALSSPPGWAGESRIDQLVAALHQWRDAG